MSIDEDDTDSKDIKEGHLGYQGLISCLKNTDLDFKTFETRCRKISKDHTYALAALPRLLERCADLLVKVAREDLILPLFDLTHCKHLVRCFINVVESFSNFWLKMMTNI